MFRWIIGGSSNDPDSAVEEISDILPLENARVNGDQFAIETQPMDGWRNQNTADMNQLQHDGKLNSWGRYSDLKDDRIMRYGK